MIEREEPKFVSFATGDVIEGVLTDIERTNVKDKRTGAVSSCVRYTVEEQDGKCVQFLGTHQLNSKLRPGDRGHAVSIRCEGEDTMVKRGDNCMKVFKVLVSEQPVSAASVTDGMLITDADIPF